MAITMIPNSRLVQESVAVNTDTGLKEGKPSKAAGETAQIKEGKKTEEAAKSDGLTASESVKASGEGGEVRVSQVHKAADTGKTEESGKGGKTENSIVRRKALDQYIPEKKAESFGHYEAVPDGKGSSKIQFDRPDQPSGETAKGEQTNDSLTGKEGVKQAGKGAEGTDGQSRKIETLKLKKRQLKEQIKAETDPKKAGELKRKLAKVEKELKGKRGKSF